MNELSVKAIKSEPILTAGKFNPVTSTGKGQMPFIGRAWDF
jgi:hypothetical protein